jgi:glycosyltransferase involved in cell wall biosynthesis
MSNSSKNPPRLLLIAGYFPPVRISTGSIRPWNLARCLIDLGWKVTVVTPKISTWDPKNLDNVAEVKKEIKKSGIQIIYTGHKFKCLAPTRYKLPQGRFFWFFGGIFRVATRCLGIQNWAGWVPSAIKACKFLRTDDVDIILATGAPFWGFEIAYRLSKRLKKPYVMDYRDLWTDNPWHPIHKKWVVSQERRLLQNSAAVTIVSPISGKVLGNKYNVKDKVFTITNGYDKEHMESVEKFKWDHFAIIFAGMLIPPELTLTPFFQVLKLINIMQPYVSNWKFHYFGPNSDLVQKEVSDWDLEKVTVVHGNISRKDMLSYQKGASLNIILSSNSDLPSLEEIGHIPGKAFELIGMKAAILPIVPKGSAIEKIMNEVGVRCFDHKETEQIADFIISCMKGHHPNLVGGEKYSWTELSKNFDQLLRSKID